jgi:hypothetical protein
MKSFQKVLLAERLLEKHLSMTAQQLKVGEAVLRIRYFDCSRARS